jgi:hypothetical protein
LVSRSKENSYFKGQGWIWVANAMFAFSALFAVFLLIDFWRGGYALPPIRPIVVPTQYGIIQSGPDAGDTGIHFRNNGEPAYMVTSRKHIDIPRVGSFTVWGTPQNLHRGEPDIAFPVSRQDRDGNSLGNCLFDFMVKHDLDIVTIPVTYRDANRKWFQTDAILIKDQMARSSDGSESGIRLDWKQKRIRKPKITSAAGLTSRGSSGS